MRTTLDLPDEILKTAKMTAAERGISLKDYFAEVMESYQKQERRQSPLRPPQRLRLPLVKHGAAKRRAVSNADIQDALDQSENLAQLER